MQNRTKPLAWYKRLVFNLLMVFGVYAAVEFASLVVLYFNHGSFKTVAELRHSAAVQDPLRPGGLLEAPLVLHPYLGAVLQPKDDGGLLSIDGRFRITEFGFTDNDLPIHKRSPDRLIVGILGGSVARQWSLNASAELAEELLKVPEFSGRAVKFVRLAANGYKQPQQLMALTYVMMLGGEFDVVINLDGFNEAALPGIDNVPLGVFTAYPRDWGRMLALTTSSEFMRMGGYVSYLRKRQQEEALWAEAIPWRFSPVAQLIWAYRYTERSATMVREMEELDRLTTNNSPFCRSGPPEHFDTPQQFYEHCTEIWTRSSRLIHNLCDAQRTYYFHFLQPNQYDEGSKPIGPEEAAMAVANNNQNRVGVMNCFPLMRAAGKELHASGVQFFDLTDVFADHPEPLYMDTCCHLKKDGDLIMARTVGQRILQRMIDK